MASSITIQAGACEVGLTHLIASAPILTGVVSTRVTNIILTALASVQIWTKTLEAVRYVDASTTIPTGTSATSVHVATTVLALEVNNTYIIVSTLILT